MRHFPIAATMGSNSAASDLGYATRTEIISGPITMPRSYTVPPCLSELTFFIDSGEHKPSGRLACIGDLSTGLIEPVALSSQGILHGTYRPADFRRLVVRPGEREILPTSAFGARCRWVTLLVSAA